MTAATKKVKSVRFLKDVLVDRMYAALNPTIAKWVEITLVEDGVKVVCHARNKDGTDKTVFVPFANILQYELE